MISELWVDNWKSYSSVHMKLHRGTQFIVAQNGVGKTSLLQAIHFAVFGDAALLGSRSPVGRAVRNGTGRATVRVAASLGDANWVIERSLAASGDVSSVVSLDGVVTREAAWRDALAARGRADFSQLQVLCAIAEGEATRVDANGGYNLVDHLSEVLGVSQLKNSAASMRSDSAALAKGADKARLTLRDRPAKLASGQEKQLEAELLVQQRAIDATEAAFSRLTQARLEWDAWEASRDSFESGVKLVQRYVERLRAALGLGNDTEEMSTSQRLQGLVARLQDRLEHVQEARNSSLRAQGAASAKLQAAEVAYEALGNAATARCPTCRRPMTEAEAAAAREEQLVLMQEARRESEYLQEAIVRLDADISRLRSLWREAVDFPSPIGSPPEVARPRDDELSKAAEAREATVQRLAELRGRLRQTEEQRAEIARNQDLSRRLEEDYRLADLYTVAAATFESTAAQICANQIEPLAQSLAKRWLELWPGRPAVGLHLDTGQLHGAVENLELGFDDLSGGERAVATLLVRLLAVQAATDSPILLLDEPLEHLDPKNRHLLAALLTAAGECGVPEQILVTTYEESVVRFAVPANIRPHVAYVKA